MISNTMQSKNKIAIFSMTAILAVSLIANINSTQKAEAVESQIDNIGNKILKEGTISSVPNPWPGHEGHQIATILPVSPGSNDNISSTTNTGYTGLLTYTASKPVQVIIPQEYTVNQSKINADKFGSGLVTSIDGGVFNLPVIQPAYNKDVPTFSYSMPFTGDGLVIHTFGDPFVLTYRVSASADEANVINEIEDNN